MGSLVLQGQHPHFQRNQVRKRAQSQIRRGSAASVWEAGEMVGAAPPLPTRSPGQISRYLSAQTFPGLQKPSSLKMRRIPGKGILQPPSRGDDIGKNKKSSCFPKTVQPYPHSSTCPLTEGEWERLRWCFLPFLLCFRPFVWRCWHSVCRGRGKEGTWVSLRKDLAT